MENYFNYYTEIEEHFQQVRGTGLFLLSPLDWALIETWKNAEIPLEAVLRGIDRSFEKWSKRKRGPRKVNSIAYCAQEVMAAAQEQAAATPAPRSAPTEPPFSQAELAKHFGGCAEKLRGHFPDVSESLDSLKQAAESAVPMDFEDVERRLTVLEEKIFAALITGASEEQLLAIRREMDQQLAPYRRKMSAEQLALVEKQFLHKKLLEQAGLPRLSLFYL